MSLFAELFARSFVLLAFNLFLDVANDHSLYFWACAAIFLRKPSSCTLRLYLPSILGFCILLIKFILVSCGMHHVLVGLVVVCFSDDVGNNSCVLGQPRLIVDFLPLEFLSELGVTFLILRQTPNSREPKVLQMQVPYKIDFSI